MSLNYKNFQFPDSCAALLKTYWKNSVLLHIITMTVQTIKKIIYISFYSFQKEIFFYTSTKMINFPLYLFEFHFILIKCSFLSQHRRRLLMYCADFYTMTLRQALYTYVKVYGGISIKFSYTFILTALYQMYN